MLWILLDGTRTHKRESEREREFWRLHHIQKKAKKIRASDLLFAEDYERGVDAYYLQHFD